MTAQLALASCNRGNAYAILHPVGAVTAGGNTGKRYLHRQARSTDTALVPGIVQKISPTPLHLTWDA